MKYSEDIISFMNLIITNYTVLPNFLILSIFNSFITINK
jgi:hypothetical protein